MKAHIFKIIELAGTSTASVEAAVANALALARKTVRNLRWFEVTETRGRIEKRKSGVWQVTIKVGFASRPDAGISR